MSTYSTMQLIFNTNGFFYYLDNDGKFVELPREQKNQENTIKFNPFFYDDIYANNDFFQLFSKYIISFDELGGLNSTAYVKKTYNSQFPFFIGFNPISFLVRSFVENIEDKKENDESYLKQLIRDLIFSNKLCYEHLPNEIKEKIVQQFIESIEQKRWTYYGWLYWNDILVKNINFARFIVRVFIHEFFHILYSHLDEKIYNPKLYKNTNLLNIAEDFVINSNIYWKNTVFSSINFKTDYMLNMYSDIPKYFSENSCMKTNYGLMLQFIEGYIKLLLDKKNEDLSDKQYENFKELYDNIKKVNQSKENITHRDVVYYCNESTKIYCNFSKNLGLEGSVNSTEFYYSILLNLNDNENKQYNVILIDDHNMCSSNSGGQPDDNLQQNQNNSISDTLKEIFEDISRKIEKIKEQKKIPPEHLKIINNIFENKFFSHYLTNNGLSINKWKRLLRNFICYDTKNAEYNVDISFKKENRRIQDLYITYVPSDKYDFILVVDVSPSINENDYAEFVNEIKKIGSQLNIQKIRLIEFNSKIVLDKKIVMNSIEKYIPKIAESSTNLQCVFETLQAENNKKPVLVFTDGCFPYFNPLNYSFKHLLYISVSDEQMKNIDKIFSYLRESNFNIVSKYS